MTTRPHPLHTQSVQGVQLSQGRQLVAIEEVVRGAMGAVCPWHMRLGRESCPCIPQCTLERNGGVGVGVPNSRTDPHLLGWVGQMMTFPPWRHLVPLS